MRGASHRPVIVLLMAVVLVTGCGSSSPSLTPASSTAPLPAQTPSTEVPGSTASPALLPTPTPKPADPFLGQVAVTVSDALRVRSEPRVADDSIKYEPLLPLGTELTVLDGPVSASGYVWYKVAPVSFTGLEGPGQGWVAMAAKDGEPWIALADAPIAGIVSEDQTAAPISALSWQRIPNEVLFAGSGSPPYENGDLQSVARWGSSLVAVGWDARGAAVWSSPDGVRWTRAADNPDFDGRGLSVVAANGRRLVAGGGAETWTSDDAIHWTRSAQLLPGGAEIVDIVPGGPGFVMATHRYAAGSPVEPQIWASGDGRLWERVAALPTSGGTCGLVTALAARGGRFVLTGASCLPGQPGLSGSFVWTSDDARTWTRADAGPELEGAIIWDVAAGPSGFVAVGSASAQAQLVAASWTSADGRAWSRHPGTDVFSDGSMVAVAWGCAGFVAVGSGQHGGASWASPDGHSWTRLGPPFESADSARSVAPFGAGFVAVGTAMPPPTLGDTNVEAIWLAPPVALSPVSPPELLPAILGRWEARAPMPQARAGRTAAIGSDGTVYFFGGLGMRGSRLAELTSVVAYDPTTDRWSSRRSLPAPLVTGSAAVFADNWRIYVFGEGASRHPVYAYKPSTDRWTTASRRASFGAAAGADGKIYAISGGVCAFDPSTSRWDTCGAPEVGYGRIVSDGLGRIYLINDQRIWSYDPATRQATSLTSIPTVRHGHTALVDRVGRIWIIGGGSSRQATMVEVYDPAKGSWARGRDGTIYVLGGYGADGLLADVTALRQ